MRRNCKILLSALFILVMNMSLFAQIEEEYKDVILDGKPAKLNIVTGEITLVNTANQKITDTLKTKTEAIKTVASDSMSSDFHIVKEGETLLDISRTYKVSLTELMKTNNLETTLLDKGQKLRIHNFDAQTEPVSPEENSNSAEAITSNFHVVQKGETLYSLSKRYHLTVNELKNQNGLNTNLIKIGQKLRIRDFEASNEINNLSVWTVQKGDTLFSIAKKSGTTVEAIKQLNGLTSNIIMIGQILQLK